MDGSIGRKACSTRISRGPSYEVDVITPAIAEEMLRGERPRAPVRSNTITAYAEIMRAGRWVLNGMPIILSPSGELLDGVQRLRACIVANAAFPSVIAWDVPAEVLHTIDRQRRRSYAGTLGARGIAHGRSVHAALVKLLRYDEEVLERPVRGAGWGAYDRVLGANPEVREAVDLSFSLRVPALHEAVRSPLVYLGQRFDPAALSRLLGAMRSPDTYRADEPGVQLRRRLEEAGDDRRGRLTSRETLALAIMALIDTATDARRRSYRWRDGRDPFPALPGYDGLYEPEPVTLRRGRGARASAIPEGVSLAVETVTPDLARRYLEANEGNRKISEVHIEAIARDIAQGRWMLNAQPVCFAATGRLLNGQHRLTATILAGQPIDVLVLRGLDHAAWQTYDQQPRRPLEIAEPEGFGDGPIVAATVTHLWRRHYRPATARGRRPSPAEQALILQDYPNLPSLRTWARQVPGLMRASVALYVAAQVTREDPGIAPDFLAQLRDGAGLRARHPILRLRSRLAAMRAAKASADKVIEAVLGTWRACRE